MTSLRNLGVVCSVDDAPAVSLHGASEGDVLADLRVKSLDSGKLYRRAFTVPEVRDGKVYAMLPGYGFGERVAIGFDALPFEAVRLWYESDTEEPFREWIEAAVSAPAPEGPQETRGA